MICLLAQWKASWQIHTNMIIVITYRDEKTGMIIVDYGVDIDSYPCDKVVVLPNVPLAMIGAVFMSTLGEYVLI